MIEPYGKQSARLVMLNMQLKKVSVKPLSRRLMTLLKSLKPEIRKNPARLPLLLLLMSLVLIPGCAQTKGIFSDNGCTWDDYIYPSRLDTPETLQQVLAHNLTHADQCPAE